MASVWSDRTYADVVGNLLGVGEQFAELGTRLPQRSKRKIDGAVGNVVWYDVIP
jgi:hypothetical protein